MLRGQKMSESHKKAIGQALIGNKNALGSTFKHTKKARLNIAKANIKEDPRKEAWRVRARKKFGKPACCSQCGTTDKRLVIHHKDLNYKNNRITNLVPLCYSCHKRTHDILQPRKKRSLN